MALEGLGTTDILVGKLMESFDDLDKCISMTKEVLSQKSNIPSEYFQIFQNSE